MPGPGTKSLEKRLSVDMVRTPQTEGSQKGNCIPMYIGVWLGRQQGKSCSAPRPNTPSKKGRGQRPQT